MKNNPEIRFEGFTDTWQLRKLGEASLILAGGDVDKNKLLPSGSYPVLANALTNDGVVGYYNNDYRIIGPAVTVTGRGDVGHAKSRKFNFTPVVRLLAVKSDYDVDFLESAINNHKITVESTGVPQLTSPQLGNYKIYFPSVNESEKIGRFLNDLTNLIRNYQQELTTLKQTKQGFLQKMFPKEGEALPEVRFAGFMDEWKEIKLGEQAIIKGRLGWKSLKQNEYLPEGPSMIAGKHIKNGKIIWNKVDHIPQWRYDESPEIMLQNGDVIFSKDGSLGNPALISDLKCLATINSTMMLVRVNETIVPSFFYQVMRSDKFERLIYLKVSGSSIPHLFQADMNEFRFFVPSTDEQIKIGEFFRQLDETIELHEQELEALKQTKKAFLQKMFV